MLRQLSVKVHLRERRGCSGPLEFPMRSQQCRLQFTVSQIPLDSAVKIRICFENIVPLNLKWFVLNIIKMSLYGITLGKRSSFTT